MRIRCRNVVLILNIVQINSVKCWNWKELLLESSRNYKTLNIFFWWCTNRAFNQNNNFDMLQGEFFYISEFLIVWRNFFNEIAITRIYFWINWSKRIVFNIIIQCDKIWDTFSSRTEYVVPQIFASFSMLFWIM